MSIKIRLKDVKVSQLNNECLLLIGRFVRELKVYRGVSLSVQDKDILMNISDYSRQTRNLELKGIYNELKSEIINSVYNSMNDGLEKIS